jgi:hypothetical protein
MLRLAPWETFLEKRTKIKSRAPHISSSCPFFVVCCLLSYLLPLTVFSFRTTTTMNNLDNTPNSNNQQAIHNKPNILYVKHLVEEDKHHQVSIFRVYQLFFSLFISFSRSTALASREPALFFRLVYLGGSRCLEPMILLYTVIDRLIDRRGRCVEQALVCCY